MTISTGIVAATTPGARPAASRVGETARALYEHELALHDAHASHVDAWIVAASDRLHDALIAYLIACREAAEGR